MRIAAVPAPHTSTPVAAHPTRNIVQLRNFRRRRRRSRCASHSSLVSRRCPAAPCVCLFCCTFLVLSLGLASRIPRRRVLPSAACCGCFRISEGKTGDPARWRDPIDRKAGAFLCKSPGNNYTFISIARFNFSVNSTMCKKIVYFVYFFAFFAFSNDQATKKPPYSAKLYRGHSLCFELRDADSERFF
jgi:hypothetical protein